jgi:hypothetical protein
MTRDNLINRRRDEIRAVMHEVLDRRDRIATYHELQDMVIHDFRDRRLHRMRQGKRGDRLFQSLMSQREVFLHHEPSRTYVYYLMVGIDHNVPQFSAVYISEISSPKGRLYLVRTSNLPHLVVFKAHFWDRYRERAALHGDREDAILRLMRTWHRTWNNIATSKEMVLWWNKDDFEQLIVTPDGVGLGICMRFPIMNEFLNPKVTKYKYDYTAVAVFSTFVSPEMLTEEQQQHLEEVVLKPDPRKGKVPVKV